ncbi:7368_t:CDS:2, partial [Gigaspora margarita]
MNCSLDHEQMEVSSSLSQTYHENFTTNSQDYSDNYFSLSSEMSFLPNIFMDNNISEEQLQHFFPLSQTYYENAMVDSQDYDDNYFLLSSELSSLPNIFVNNDILEEQPQHLFDFDSSDQESNSAYLKLYVGQPFQTWDNTEIFLNDYGMQQGFSIRRRRTEASIENNQKIVRRIGWECSYSGKYQPKKPLTLNNSEVESLKQQIVLVNVPKYCKLGSDIIEFVEFCVMHSTTGARNICSLLKEKFMGRKIYKNNFYNAIQNVKKKINPCPEFDASDMLYYLYNQKSADSRWFIEPKFDVATALLENETQESFMWALAMIKRCTNNLMPRVIFTDCDLAMANAISKEFQQFENDFFFCHNTLLTNLFESQWQSLKMKYPSAVQYINHQLEPLKVKWAACYNNTQFTAGANTTQCVESLNKKIYDCVQKKSLLLNLTKEIQEILDNEAKYMRIEEYKDQIPTTRMMTVNNMNYDDLIKNQVDQDYVKEACKDNYEASKILLEEILSTIDRTKIVEIWQLAISGSLTSHYLILISDGSYRCTCNLLITHGYPYLSGTEHISNTSDFNLVYIKQLCSNEIYTPELRQINSNHIKYGRAQGIMHKMIDLVLDTNSYEEMIRICHEFIFNKQQKLNHKKQDNLDLNVQNPIITTRKGRPAGRIKSSIEIQDNKLNQANILQSLDNNLNTQSINIDLNANSDSLEAKNTCKDKKKNVKIVVTK